MKIDFKKSSELTYFTERNDRIRQYHLLQVAIMRDLESEVKGLLLVVGKFTIRIGFWGG